MYRSKKPDVKWMPWQRKRAGAEQIRVWFKNGDRGIAGVTGRISGMVVIDVDSKEGLQAIGRYFNPKEIRTPISRTPNGWHFFFKHPGGVAIGNNARRIDGCDFRGDGGYIVLPPTLGENGTPYTWIRKPNDFPLAQLPELYLKEVLMDFKPKPQHFKPLPRPEEHKQVEKRGGEGLGGGKEECTKEGITTGKPVKEEHQLVKGSRDEAFYHLAVTLRRGGASRSFVEQTISAVWEGRRKEMLELGHDRKPFKLEDAVKKAGQVFDAPLPRERNTSLEVSEWVDAVDGVFTTKDIDGELRLNTKEEKAIRRTTMWRLVEQGVIEKDGKRNGVFRKILEGANKINWKEASLEDEWKVEYPFGIENFYITLPKTINLLAGAKDSGKSAFALNFAYRNAPVFPGRIHYFSSEMGAVELKHRIRHFEWPERFDDVLFYDRSGNFSDVIKPNDINIIDYMELEDEFYKVNFFIRKIFEKLEKGIAFICIQKQTGAKHGRGGEFGKEKARLVLRMERHFLEIDVCKNWRDPLKNPVGKIWKGWKLVKGCKFIEGDAGSWIEL